MKHIFTTHRNTWPIIIHQKTKTTAEPHTQFLNHHVLFVFFVEVAVARNRMQQGERKKGSQRPE
jgi:hypothetical protein